MPRMKGDLMTGTMIVQALTVFLSFGLVGIAAVWFITVREERQYRRSSLLKKVRLARRSKQLTKVLAYLTRRRS